MSPARLRALYALFAIYVIATAVHVGWVLAHEPFFFDAWNVAVDTNATPVTVGNFFDYWWGQYTNSNPRLGQPLTYLGYKLEYFAEIFLPLCLLAVSAAATTLGLGRLPWKSPRGTALWAIAIGFVWFALPDLGRNLFCRAYGLNYIFGAAMQLWFLVPLRLVPSRDASVGRCAAYAVFGFAAGMCNEHTGPALVLLLAALAFWHYRRGERPRLLWAGAAGYFFGFVAIFFAPGQGSRYDGLAQQMSLFERVLSRGIEGNFAIFREYVVWAAPVLGLIVLLLLVARERPRGPLTLIAIALGVGSLVAMTMFVSPKLGARFHFVGLALLLGGFLALLDAVATRPRYLAPFVVFAVITSVYAATRTVPLYRTVARQAAHRMKELAATKPGDVYVADAWAQVDETWWFIGDDFRDFRKRELVAKYYGLSRVLFRKYLPAAPLGTTGTRVSARYWTVGASCAAEYDELDFGLARGFDIAQLHTGARESIATLQRSLGDKELELVELPVTTIGDKPALPRPQLLLARWERGAFTGYIGKFVRRGRERTRDVEIPKELHGRGVEIFLYNVGGEYRSLGPAESPRAFEPWERGIYWLLACEPTERCYVIAANRM